VFSSRKKSTLIFLSSLVAFGCTKATPPCSTPEDINKPECVTQIPDINTTPATLSINFKDTYFYDQNSKSWQTIQRSRLLGGTTGSTIQIYSNFLNSTLDSALAKTTIAAEQNQDPSKFSESNFNTIPYIELVPEEGAEYLFDYVKKDLNNNVIFEKIGKVPFINGKPILPLVNTVFDNQFYPADSSVGSRFIHSINFAAQSRTKKGSVSGNIDFETSFQIPPTDFTIGYSSQVQSFNLKKRWKTYFKDRDFVANTSFPFFTLKEIKEKPEQIPLDVKFVFQRTPTLRMEQEVFFELPLDYDTFITSGEIIPLRGSRFYSKKVLLDSVSDFKMNATINSRTVPLVAQKEYEYLNLPAGTPWELTFNYDFTQNVGYPASSNGLGLLTPLRPICNELAKKSFGPIKEQTERDAAIANNGFISLCHPTLNKKVTIAPNAVSTVSLLDSWFDFFSYIPYNPFKKELGHLYGIKNVKFISEGCVRILTREVGTNSYIIKSKGSPQCSDPASTGTNVDNGWVYFYAEKVFTIFDDLPRYESVDGLKPLIQTFSSKPTITDYDNFWFNGYKNDVRHIF
jgi:hypothetical protein